MKDIIEARDLPKDEKVYLKKSLGDWRVVYPIQKENKKIDWFVFLTGGSWWILVKVILVVAMILFLSYSYMHDTKECRDLLANICDYSLNISRACSVNLITITNNPLVGLENLGGLNVQEKT